MINGYATGARRAGRVHVASLMGSGVTRIRPYGETVLVRDIIRQDSREDKDVRTIDDGLYFVAGNRDGATGCHIYVGSKTLAANVKENGKAHPSLR